MESDKKYLSDLDLIKKTALERISSARDKQQLAVDELSALVGVCKSATEAEKTEIEKANLLKLARSEAVRFWVPILASFLSVLIVAGTFFVQRGQFKEAVDQNNRLNEQQHRALEAQRDANEDTQWREALKLMADKQGLVNDAGGVALLKHFSMSPRIGPQARDLAVSMLGYMSQAQAFDTLFDSVIGAKDKDALPAILTINRMLGSLNAQLSSNSKDVEKAKQAGARTVSASLSTSGQVQLAPVDVVLRELQDRRGAVIREEQTTGKAIADLMRKGNLGGDIDMSDCFFVNTDFSKVAFNGTNINAAGFWNVNVQDADFGHVVLEDIGQWDDTAWWRAAKMTPMLLNKLLEKYSFPQGRKEYLGSTLESYSRDVERLQKLAGI